MLTVNKYYVKQLIQYIGDRGKDGRGRHLGAKRNTPTAGFAWRRRSVAIKASATGTAFSHTLKPGILKVAEGPTSCTGCTLIAREKGAGVFIGPSQDPNCPTKRRRKLKKTARSLRTYRSQKHMLLRPLY